MGQPDRHESDEQKDAMAIMSRSLISLTFIFIDFNCRHGASCQAGQGGMGEFVQKDGQQTHWFHNDRLAGQDKDDDIGSVAAKEDSFLGAAASRQAPVVQCHVGKGRRSYNSVVSDKVDNQGSWKIRWFTKDEVIGTQMKSLTPHLLHRTAMSGSFESSPPPLCQVRGASISLWLWQLPPR
jgi:hypothetical protein